MYEHRVSTVHCNMSSNQETRGYSFFIYKVYCQLSRPSGLKPPSGMGNGRRSATAKAVIFIECSPFLEKERGGGGLKAPMCPFVSFYILPWLAGNKYLFVDNGVKKRKWFLSFTTCHFQPRVMRSWKWY